MTIDSKLVLRAARTMIGRFGHEALAEVELRIAELRDRDQPEAEELWRQIREAVRFLTSSPNSDTEH